MANWLLAQLVGVIGNHMDLVLLAAGEYVIVVIAIKVFDVTGIKVVNLAVSHKGRPRVRAARIQIGIGEQRRPKILVRHKVLRCHMIQGRDTMQGIKRVVLMIDVVGIANLDQTIGVIEPAKLGLHMEQKPVRISRNTSRRLVLPRTPTLVVRTRHLVLLIEHVICPSY